MALQDLLTDDYKVDLEVFEGPLDLLLYLIRREELDIYDIPIEKITNQYMRYLDVMRMLDLNIAGEFVLMASTLMMIKSRMLLPVESRQSEEQSDDEWVDPRLDLVRQLIEYKKFKDVAEQFSTMEFIRSEAFGYGGEKFAEPDKPLDAEQALADIGIFDLLTAFQEVLDRVPVHPLEEIEPVQWSVTDKMEVIIRLTAKGEQLHFSKLFTPGVHRNEVVVTFLALLELLRLHQIQLFQHMAFQEIIIVAATTHPADEPVSATEPEENHVTQS